MTTEELREEKKILEKRLLQVVKESPIYSDENVYISDIHSITSDIGIRILIHKISVEVKVK